MYDYSGKYVIRKTENNKWIIVHKSSGNKVTGTTTYNDIISAKKAVSALPK